MASGGPVVVNPTSRPRGGVVELRLPGQDDVPGAQVLSSLPGGRGRVRNMRAADLAAFVATIHDQRLDDTTFVNGIEIEDGDDGILVVLQISLTKRPGASVEQARAALYDLLEQRRPGWCRLQIEREPRQTVLVRVDDVPGFGWKRWQPTAVSSGGVSVNGKTMTNGLATVAVAEDGTFSLNGIAGMGRLVDDGDQGDTYNYCPPATDLVVDIPDEVEIAVAESGPVRGSVAIRRRYRWPERIDDDTSTRVGEVTTDVFTFLELRAGEAFVRVTHAFDNRNRDHRLRAVFPLVETAAVSRAECAFAVVERGLEAEGGVSEKPLATFPSRRFVQAGGVTIAHEGLLEYEVVDGGRALALTLLRATAMLSRGPMDYRPEPAGPLVHLEGPQVQRHLELKYAVQVGDCDPYALADDLLVPLQIVVAGGGGDRGDEGTELTVDGAEVSAVIRSGGLVEVRVFNPSDHPAEAVIPGRRGWLVDLRGRPTVPFEGSFVLRPWEIATARLEP
jgi:mannosylglycerate hydrolase